MTTLRDELIELAARALCTKRGYDPDKKMPKTVGAEFRRCEIGEPLWKEHTEDARIVLDVVFDYQRRKVAASQNRPKMSDPWLRQATAQELFDIVAAQRVNDPPKREIIRRMKKLTPTQINALRLASYVPTCLTSDFGKSTTEALMKRGLLESYGTSTISDGHVRCAYGLTDAGREALAACQ